MGLNLNSWKKYHRFQEKDDWCGIAVIQMALLRCGIKKSQREIARDVFIKWWGVSPQIMLAYLARFFKIVNYKNNATLGDISHHLKKGHIIIVDYWDDFDSEHGDGHYSIVANYNSKTKFIELVDPSREREGIWQLESKKFTKNWWDTIVPDGRLWTSGQMIWIDPKSKL